MGQNDVINFVTGLFAQKMEKVGNDIGGIVDIVVGDEPVEKKSGVQLRIELLAVENNCSRNICDKVQLKESDGSGAINEYFVEPPTLYDIKYAVIPYCSSKNELFKVIGSILRLMKDDGFIEVQGFDWHENNGCPIKINSIADMTLGEQIQILSVLNISYRPSLFYMVTVGINSEKKEFFRRVKEKKFESVKLPVK